jgi:hypothetical protein
MAKSKKSKGSRRGGASRAFGSIGNVLKTVLVGFGAASVGSLIADRVGVNPMIPSAGLGYVAGGTTGAIAGLLTPFLTRSLGTGGSQQAQIGQVVWA